MKLYDFLEVFDENKKVDVWDSEDTEDFLTFYDGFNSIDLDFLYCDIACISSHFDEHDEVPVVDIYIKQDALSNCRTAIANYLRNEFEHGEQDIYSQLQDKEIELAYTTSSQEGCENVELQASYRLDTETLILRGGHCKAIKTVKHEDIDDYLNFDYLTGLCDDLVQPFLEQ